MSSDEYFDDELDSAFLNELHAIEVAHASQAAAAVARPLVVNTNAPSKPPAKTSFKPAVVSNATSIHSKAPTAAPLIAQKLPPSTKPQPSRRVPPPEVIELGDSSDYDNAFDDIVFDEAVLASIDKQVQHEYANMDRRGGPSHAQPVAGPSNQNALVRRPSRGAQLNLFGEVAQELDSSKLPGESNKRTFTRTRSSMRQMPLPGQAKRTKQWDRTAYAKSGWRKPKDKGKERDDDDDGDEEQIEFEQFPAPEMPVG